MIGQQPWCFDMSMMETMYVIRDAASSACVPVLKRHTHSLIEPGGLVRNGVRDMVGWLAIISHCL